AAVKTPRTPGIARAAAVSMPSIAACPCGERSTMPCSWPGMSMSSTKRPCPVRNRQSSSRRSERPICASVIRSRRLSADGSRIISVTAGAAMGKVQGEQALGKGAIGGRLVARRVVGADTGRDAIDDRIVVWPEKKRDRVARGTIAVDHTVRRRAEAIVRIARQHRPGVDDKCPRHRRRAYPLALGRAHLKAGQRRLREEGNEIVVGVRRETGVLVLR